MVHGRRGGAQAQGAGAGRPVYFEAGALGLLSQDRSVGAFEDCSQLQLEQEEYSARFPKHI